MTRRPHRIPGTPARTLYLLADIPDDLDPDTKNALALRNACNVNGQCPDCGATPTYHNDTDVPNVVHAVFRHDDNCAVLRDPEPA